MKIRDQIKRDRETMASLTRQQKVKFVFDYYKLPIIFGTLLVIALAAMVITWLQKKDVALYAVFVNANTESVDETLFDDYVFPDGKGNSIVDIQANYTLNMNTETMTESDAASLQVLSAMFGIGDLDLFASDETVFEKFAAKDAFLNLGLFIEAEVLESYPGGLYRCTNEDGEEIVAGLWVKDGSVLQNANYFYGDAVIGVAALAENLDEALAVITGIIEAANGK